MDHRPMTPARERQAEVEQPVLQHHTGHRDRLALEHGEIGDAQHPGPVLLQEHHLAGRTMQGPLQQGALAPLPLLARNGPLHV